MDRYATVEAPAVVHKRCARPSALAPTWPKQLRAEHPLSIRTCCGDDAQSRSGPLQGRRSVSFAEGARRFEVVLTLRASVKFGGAGT